MTKVTITIEDGDPEKVANAIKAVERELNPQPGSDGQCNCSNPDIDVRSDWAGGSSCRKCGGYWY